MEMNWNDGHQPAAPSPAPGEVFVPPSQQPFSFRNRWKSIGYTVKGAQYLFRTQHSTWIQVPIILSVLIAGAWLGIGKWDWIALILASGLILITEALNTAVETVVDLVSPEYNRLAGTAKDVAAGAVLLAAVTGFAVMLVTLTPYVLDRLG